MMTRRHNFQTVSWFYDLKARGLLNLDPPYQRRSVWNQAFKDYFIDTILLGYPAPAIFLYEEINPTDGRSKYHVVDGKQRLTAVIEFIEDAYPVNDDSELSILRGKYFSALDDDRKRHMWGYQFLVEYVPSDDEKIINAIFDRINRNMAKLTPQELRHARLDGEFIKSAENLADWMTETLPKSFPRFNAQARKQMKDVEYVGLLLLLLEGGAKGYSQEDLDFEFTSRDQSWDMKHDLENRFRDSILTVKTILDSNDQGRELITSRLRNQADFYSLIGAISKLKQAGSIIAPERAAELLLDFTHAVEDQDRREADAGLAGYYEAARAASNDKGARDVRIQYMTKLLGIAS